VLGALAFATLAAGCAGGPVRAPPAAALPPDATEQPERYMLVTIANPGVPLPTRAGSTLRGYDASPSYAVSSVAAATAKAIATDYEIDEVSAWPIASLRVHCVMYRIREGESREALLTSLAADPRVQIAQALQTFATSTDAYDDQYVGLQRSFVDMSVAAAHQWSLGAGVTVAIVDTGVDLEHPDLAGRAHASRNFVDADATQFSRDWHGTEIAGVIAAVGNNGRGIVGIAPQVRLLAYKACWQTGRGDASARCNSYTLAQAIAAAIDAEADVINLSLVGPTDPLLAALAERATARGSIVVGAVPASGRPEGFPSGTPGVLPVAMAEETAPSTALQAPGREILTLVPNGSYDFATGSSLATANVSGVVALLRARRQHVTATDARTLLARSTRDVPASSDQVRSIDACAALASLLAKSGCPSGTADNAGAARRQTRAIHDDR
jgi:subtilisin family serine protease